MATQIGNKFHCYIFFFIFTACPTNKYGYNCKGTCGNCYENQCDAETGRCLKGCSAGSHGQFCRNCKYTTHNPNIGPVMQKETIAIFVLSISLNICFGCSKEPSHRDCSLEYPQHMFWLRNKK